MSVILPLHRWHERTDAAIASILDQHGVDVELLVILNGTEPDLGERARQALSGMPQARALRQPVASLPAALNLGLREASHEFVARMDGDDLSLPGRLVAQAEHLTRHTSLAGCGCAARFLDTSGRPAHTVTPPCRPEEARWRLLVSNAFVHGSMMLRRDAVRAAGGYDKQHDRAQDYELWLRLAQHGLGGIPDVLYVYHMGDREYDDRQSDLTAAFLLDAWAALPEGDHTRIRPLMARLVHGDAAARAELEQLMEHTGPSRAALQAWLWSCWRCPISRTDSVARERRIRHAAGMLRSEGIDAVWLWGAGDLARTITASGVLGAPIAGVVDDARAGSELAGHTVRSPDALSPGDTVLIASDAYEDAIWDRSASARARGVRVLRLPGAE